MSKASKKFILFIFIIILVILISLIIFFINNKNDEDITNTPEIQKLVKNQTEDKQGQIELKDVNIQSIGSNIIVKGKVINEGSMIRRCDVALNLYNNEEQLKGRQDILIENLQSNEEREFEISIMGDYANLDNYKIVIENIEN